MQDSSGPRGVVLDGGEAVRVAEMLDILAELPSTPELIAGEARYRARALAGMLAVPAHHRAPGERPLPDPVALDRVSATGIAGLLELAAGMPSTPPDLADDALDQADRVWALLRTA